MGTILEFPAARQQGERRSTDGLSGGAEIVIFPGVRIERWSDEDTPSRSGFEPVSGGEPRGGRRRKRR